MDSNPGPREFIVSSETYREIRPYIATPGTFIQGEEISQLIGYRPGPKLIILFIRRPSVSADVSDMNSHMKSPGGNFDGESEIPLLW